MGTAIESTTIKITVKKRTFILNLPSLRIKTPEIINVSEEKPVKKKKDKLIYLSPRPGLKKLTEPDFFFPLIPLCPLQNRYLIPEQTIIS
jgi:hypothetical protein